MRSFIRFFSSLKLAIFVLLGLAISLAAGTIIESAYDTPTSQYFVYRSWWFHALLALLGVNILVVALSRLPWKKRHLAFLLAHLGILLLLVGSWITEQYGLDGNLRIGEGETSGTVELDRNSLVVIDRTSVERIPIRWQPPSVDFRPIRVADHGLPYDLTVDRFVSHAEPIYSFVPATASAERPAGLAPRPAIRLKLTGGPMRLNQDIWLWAGEEGWRSLQMGPAWFMMGEAPKNARGELSNEKQQKRPGLEILPQPDGSVRYRAWASDGKKTEETFRASEIVGRALSTGWKGGVQIAVGEWLADAVPNATYRPSRIDRGNEAPPSAIHLVAGKGGEGSEVWLGLGERAVLQSEGREVEVGYLPQRLTLPFSVRLERFTVEHYEGTIDPSSYASQVTLIERDLQKPILISMNEPLKHRGITLYQASYEDAQPRPTVSILSVNRDPGRPLKYTGSLLLVLGSILLFVQKTRQARKRPKPAEVSS